MIDDKMIFNHRILNHFINNALGLSYESHKITGFELLYPLLNAASHNTYIETVSNKADTLYSDIKGVPKKMEVLGFNWTGKRGS